MKRQENEIKRQVDKVFDTVFTKVYEELEDSEYYSVEDIIYAELGTIAGGIDDLMLTAYASVGSRDYEEPTIHGEVRFCVYGGVSYEELARKVKSVKSEFLTITSVWHPEQTPGISFNGVYEDEDTTYIGAHYELRMK